MAKYVSNRASSGGSEPTVRIGVLEKIQNKFENYTVLKNVEAEESENKFLESNPGLPHAKISPMEFEDILKDVGGFGRYQKYLMIFFIIPVFIVLPWFSMNTIFINNSPDHWCYVPEVARSNLSLTQQLNLIRPAKDLHCLTYDVNFTSILQSGNLTVNKSWPTRECKDGWQFDQTNYDATSVTKWNMVCKDSHFSSLVLSLSFMGDVIGTPIFGFISDKWGRKPTFLVMCLLIALSEIGSVLSPVFWLCLALRAVNGACMSTVYGVAYIIALEIVSPNMRTRMNGVATTSWTAGLCLLPVLAYLTRDWIRMSIVTSLTSAVLLLYWVALPESPSWLISQEKYEEAAKIMAKISKVNGKRAHEGTQLLEKIKRFGETEKKQKDGEEAASPMDFFKYPTLRKRFLIVTICWVGNSIPYFGLQMNVKNLAGNEFFNFFLISLIEVPAHVVTWLIMVKVGRRWCSVGAYAISTVACFLPVFAPDYATMGVVASLLAKAGTSSAFMTLYQQGPELFPTTLRGVGLGLATTIGTGSTLVVPYIVALSSYGTFIPFLSFAVISFLSSILASFLPETLDKALPQTVLDAENFEKNFPYCSCGSKSSDIEEQKQNTWAPETLSVIDLSNSIKSQDNPVGSIKQGFFQPMSDNHHMEPYSPTKTE